MESLLVTFDTGLATYALYKYLNCSVNEKLKEVCFQSNHHWTGSKAIRELHEITFIFKEIKYPHYEVNKPNEQH